MGSFYGGAGWSQSGGSTTDGTGVNYNKISNQPIVNIGSTSEDNFVVLVGLSEKHYNLTGYYKMDSSDEVHYAESPLDVLIYKDTTTDYKVIQYFSAEGGKVYLNVRTYSGTTLVSSDKLDLTDKSTPTWGEL